MNQNILNNNNYRLKQRDDVEDSMNKLLGNTDQSDTTLKLYTNLNKIHGKDEVKTNSYISLAKKGHMDKIEKIIDTIGEIYCIKKM